MKRTALLCLGLAALLLPASAAAQYEGPDVIGIYFDQNATSMMIWSLSPYTPLTAYLIATNLSEPTGVSGWEGSVYTNPPELPIPFTVQAAGGGGACTLPNLRVTLATPLPRTRATVLATMQTFYLGGYLRFYVGPCEPTSFPESPGPGYSPGGDPSRLIRLRTWLNDPDPEHPDRYFVACILCDILPTQTSSWSAVKSLYGH